MAAALLLFPTLCIAQNYGKFRLVEAANHTTKDHTPVIGSVKSGEAFNVNGKEIIFNKDERNASSLFKVKINGNEVKVYKTGSFGTDVKLSPGENIVKVELYSVDGALLASGERTISRIEPAKREADNAKESRDGNDIVRDAAGNEVIHVNHMNFHSREVSLAQVCSLFVIF